MKTCSHCKKEYPATTEYFNRNNSTKDGFSSWCRNCLIDYKRKDYKNNKDKYKQYYQRTKKRHNENAKKWRERNPKKQKEIQRRANLKRYGITIKEYDYMFKKQKGKCIICGTHQSKLKNKLYVDHDHKTGEVRGLLCISCNTAIGSLNDNPLILIRAIKYLRGEL